MTQASQARNESLGRVGMHFLDTLSLHKNLEHDSQDRPERSCWLRNQVRTCVASGRRPWHWLVTDLTKTSREWHFRKTKKSRWYHTSTDWSDDTLDIYFHQRNADEHHAALQLRDAVLRLRRDGAFVAVPLFRVNTDPIGPHPVGKYRFRRSSYSFQCLGMVQGHMKSGAPQSRLLRCFPTCAWTGVIWGRAII